MGRKGSLKLVPRAQIFSSPSWERVDPIFIFFEQTQLQTHILLPYQSIHYNKKQKKVELVTSSSCNLIIYSTWTAGTPAHFSLTLTLNNAQFTHNETKITKLHSLLPRQDQVYLGQIEHFVYINQAIAHARLDLEDLNPSLCALIHKASASPGLWLWLYNCLTHLTSNDNPEDKWSFCPRP